MPSRDITIDHHNSVHRGEYHATTPSCEGTAKLSWTDRDGVRHAEHTFVPDDCRGKGIAGELVKAMVADARDQGFKIAPDCSYVATWFDRHPDQADLRA